MNARGWIARVRAAAKGLAARLRRQPRPAMVGTPPSARKIPAIPADPAEHAVQFAHTWADRLEHHVEGRMHALDIPEHQIGASDLEHGVPWRVFFPHERTGGGNVPGGRITVYSGVLNPELNAEKYGPRYASLWKKARLRDRIDSIIVHEYEEAKGVSHAEAVARAPDTELPVRRQVRDILRAMAEGETDRGRG
jgi:hypothetical protein